MKIVTTNSFDEVVGRIDAGIGHPDMAAFRKNLSNAESLAKMEGIVHPAAQPSGLMEFARFDLGEILRKENGTSRPRILRIVTGNPLIMKEMVRHVVDAGSYAPVTILIHEQTDGVCISDGFLSCLVR